jgi:hypothetical protein
MLTAYCAVRQLQIEADTAAAALRGDDAAVHTWRSVNNILLMYQVLVT